MTVAYKLLYDYDHVGTKVSLNAGKTLLPIFS